MALQTTLHRYFVNKGVRRRRRQTLITEYMIPRRKKRVCQYLMTDFFNLAVVGGITVPKSYYEEDDGMGLGYTAFDLFGPPTAADLSMPASAFREYYGTTDEDA